MTIIPSPNLNLLVEREDLLARVRVLDTERDTLITQREYVKNEKQSRVLAAEIILLGNQANALENQAHEIYQRAWTNCVAIGDLRGPEWDAELFEANAGDALEALANNEDAGDVIRERKAGGQL